MVGVRGALIAREGYEAYQNTAAAYQNFKDENYGTAAFHAGLAVLNAFGVKAGIGQLKNDLKYAFPASHVPFPSNLAAANRQLNILNQINCFAPDTLIATPNGPRPIGEIFEGDSTLAYNFKSGVWVVRRVTKRHENVYEGPVVTLTTDGGPIRTTVYHPFWVLSGRDLAERSTPRKLDEMEDQGQSLPGRWVNSHELRVGDVLFGQDGKQRILLRIEQEYRSAFPVFNLTIDEHHSFAVGADAVLVHNTAECELVPTAGTPPLLPIARQSQGVFRLIHGNSAASPRKAYLYQLFDAAGTFLKWGITQDLAKRYPKAFMIGKRIVESASGTRAEMLKVERILVETQPGPLNLEKWAGARLGE
jgi:hypothetical protein